MRKDSMKEAEIPHGFQGRRFKTLRQEEVGHFSNRIYSYDGGQI